MRMRTVVEPTAEGLIAALREPGPSGSTPTALACWNDMVAYWAMSQCRRAGISVPQEIAITGFDGIRSEIQADASLTTVHAPWAQVASAAINHLLDLHQGKPTPSETVLPVDLVLGDTA
jgi:LacI family transcriptional regulator